MFSAVVTTCPAAAPDTVCYTDRRGAVATQCSAECVGGCSPTPPHLCTACNHTRLTPNTTQAQHGSFQCQQTCPSPLVAVSLYIFICYWLAELRSASP